MLKIAASFLLLGVIYRMREFTAARLSVRRLHQVLHTRARPMPTCTLFLDGTCIERAWNLHVIDFGQLGEGV
jgi:hypothetical protein